MFKFWRQLKNDSGAALMMAIFTVTMLMSVAMDLMYETTVEVIVSSQAVNRVKAYYAAKAGIEISLLRLHIFRKATAMAGGMLPNKSMLDPIWQFPFAWPPILPEEISGVDKDQVKSVVKASSMDAKYFVSIDSEGSKIDINDLASPSKVIAEATKKQILQILNGKVENDENFGRRMRGYDFDNLINNIADWIDPDKESRNGGDESAPYGDRGGGDFLPPNQPFKTVAELHLVEGMTDDIYETLASRITVFGAKAVNVNYASKEVLMSLSPELNEERVTKLIEDRGSPNRGPFKDEEDFTQYLSSIGVRGNPFKDEKTGQATVPLTFDAEHNFRIRSTGSSGKVTREITAIVYDVDKVKNRLKDLLIAQQPKNDQPQDPSKPPTDDDQAKTPQPTPTPGKSQAKSDTDKVPNERPNIVYWNEE